MSKRSYVELLKDPRWQRKRLEVLAAHSFLCDWCESDTKTLHVHHGQYLKGLMPWEYEAMDYHVLCEECHKARHGLEVQLKNLSSKMSADDLSQLIGYAVGMFSGTDWDEHHVIGSGIFGLSDCLSMHPGDIADNALSSGNISLGKLAHARGSE